MFNQANQLNPNAMEQYKAFWLFCEKNLITFNTEDKVLQAINKLIFKSILTCIINQVAYSAFDP